MNDADPWENAIALAEIRGWDVTREETAQVSGIHIAVRNSDGTVYCQFFYRTPDYLAGFLKLLAKGPPRRARQLTDEAIRSIREMTERVAAQVFSKAFTGTEK